MSIDKSKQQVIRLQVLCDRKTGKVYAAGPASIEASGDDAPQEFRLIPGDDEVSEEIVLTPKQAQIPLPELFANHVVQKGQLVPAKHSK